MSAFYLVVEGEESGRTFFQCITIEAEDVPAASVRVAAYLQRIGARLVEIDPEETREVDVEALPAQSRCDANPDHVLAMTGRIWVEQSQ